MDPPTLEERALIQWSVAARTMPGQCVSGDLHLVKRWEHHLLLAVIDGVGHGGEAAAAAQRLIAQTGGMRDIGEQTLADNLRLYVGIRELVRRNKLDAYSVRCWPELRDLHKITPCAAHALMSQDGVPIRAKSISRR